jgi:uncharacterized protein with ATP-grasp and redox domains
MNTYLDCIPCVLRQTLATAKMVSDDTIIHEKVMREVLQEVSTMNFDRSPVEIAIKIHRILRELSGNPDPYREIKQHSNQRMLSLYPQLLERIKSAEDSLEMAIRLAIAANIIDFGAKHNLDDETIDRVMAESIAIPLDRELVAKFRQEVQQANTILYLGDNAGEIVCDRLLIEQLPQEKITYVVRGNPIINDVTIADAQIVGITELVPVIDNGSDAPGTVLSECSPEFRDRFQAADLIIAKGQGNYESLSSNTDKNIFFLLKAKCPVIAHNLNCLVGATILQQNRP